MSQFQTSYATMENTPDDIKVPDNINVPNNMKEAIINIPYMVGRFSITHNSMFLKVSHYFTFPIMKLSLIIGILCIPLAIGVSNNIDILTIISIIFVILALLITGIIYYKNLNNGYIFGSMVLYDMVLVVASIYVTIGLNNSPGNNGAYLWLLNPVAGIVLLAIGGSLQFILFHRIIDGKFPDKKGPEFIPKWLDDIIRLWYGILFVSMALLYDNKNKSVPINDIKLYEWTKKEYS